MSDRHSYDGHSPLYLLDQITLDDLDTTEARHAATARRRAFHEAGHVWAARSTGGEAGVACIRVPWQPYTFSDGATAEWVAAAGPLAQAIGYHADSMRYDGEFLRLDDDIPARAIRDSIAAACPCGCRRGGDAAVAAVLLDPDWIAEAIPRLMRAWPGIERLAVRLMTGDPIGPDEVAAHLDA